MAYSIINREFVVRKEGIAAYRITAILDSVDDLAAIGTDVAPGSIAIVAGPKFPTYMMNASGEWVEG